MADGIIPNAPQFPMGAVIRAKEGNNPYEGLNDLVPRVLQMYQKQKQQQQWQETIGKLMADPNTSDGIRQVAMLMGADPSQARYMLPALTKAEVAPKGADAGGKSTWYETSDGKISKTQTPGAFPVQLSDAQGAQYTAVPESAREKNKAMTSRSEAMQRGIDVKQINELVRKTGITPKQLDSIQSNSFRGSRALPILSKENLSYQELALGQIDLAGMMHGGVPGVDEYKDTQFPGWQKTWGDIQTYATGHPAETVPTDVRQKVLDLVKGNIEVDNQFIKANKRFAKTMLGPTIRGGITPTQDRAIEDVTKTLTLKDQPAASSQSQGGWSYVGPAQ